MQIWKSGRESSLGFVKAQVLRIDRPLSGGFNVPPLAGGKVVRSTKGGWVVVVVASPLFLASFHRQKPCRGLLSRANM